MKKARLIRSPSALRIMEYHIFVDPGSRAPELGDFRLEGIKIVVSRETHDSILVGVLYMQNPWAPGNPSRESAEIGLRMINSIHFNVGLRSG